MNETNPQKPESSAADGPGGEDVGQVREHAGRGHTRSGEHPHGEHPHAVGHWVGDKVYRVFGPPPVGPYDDAAVSPSSDAACPLCGAPMSEHVIDRWGHDTDLQCPRPPLPSRS